MAHGIPSLLLVKECAEYFGYFCKEVSSYRRVREGILRLISPI